MSRKFFFTGASGTGKSTAALELIKTYPFVWLFVFDHDGEYGKRLNGFVCHTEEDVLQCIASRKAVVFDPGAMFPGQTREAFEWFCEVVWASRNQTGTKLFFFDEPAIYLPSNAARFESHPIRKIIETGRRFKIDAVFAAQRPADVHNAIRQQATDIFCFRQGDATSADWLTSKGYDWTEIERLEDGEFVYLDTKTGKRVREQIELKKAA